MHNRQWPYFMQVFGTLFLPKCFIVVSVLFYTHFIFLNIYNVAKYFHLSYLDMCIMYSFTFVYICYACYSALQNYHFVVQLLAIK